MENVPVVERNGGDGSPSRSHGGLSELVCVQPTDHIGWVFSGPDEFAALASAFLAEGASRGERLMYIGELPEPPLVADFAAALEPETLQITCVADVYGSSGFVDAESQRGIFDAILTEAIGAGYSGLRVAADNTSLVTDPQRLEAWIHWELVADRFMAENSATGLCAFDRQRVDVGKLRHLATLHPLWPVDEAVPQYRIFYDNRSFMWVEGQIDSFAIQQVRSALRKCPPETGLVVDLRKTSWVTTDLMSRLLGLRETGRSLTIRGVTDRVWDVAQMVGTQTDGISWIQD